jgi:hypothetical protein
MKVLIKEKYCEYESDYPDGWQYSAGDPFKFPVSVGNYPCFIKRFEKKSPEDITGWDLLQQLKGKNEPHLVRLYDILNVQENGKDVYYLFFEYLEGLTLDKMISQKYSIDLKRLTDDLFIAIGSLQHNSFWFVDFFERNIFFNNKGSFILVDLDSAHPVNEAPQNDMYGNKDYWILVFKFYQQVLQNTAIQISDINGISFNYMHIAFLILRIKLYVERGETDYNASIFYEKLPLALSEIAPDIKEVFTTVYQNKQRVITADDIQRIKQIIVEKIIPWQYKTPLSVKAPVIRQFVTSKSKLKDKEQFTLSWEITDADKVELYKNNVAFKQFDGQEVSTTILESFENHKQEIRYYLVAYSGSNSVISETIAISKIKRGIGFLLLKILVWIVGIIILLCAAAVIITMLNHTQNYSTQTEKAYEDSVVVIESKNTITHGKLNVSFNNIKATIKSSSDSSLTVIVPDLKDTTVNDIMAKLSVVENNREVFSTTLPYVKKVRIDEISPAKIIENTAVMISGKNLNSSDIKVYFNDQEAPIISKYSNTMTVEPPDLTDAFSGQNFNLSVISGGNSIFIRPYWLRSVSNHLVYSADSAIWTTGVLSSDQYSITNPIRLDFQNSELDSRGSARLDTITMENGRSYQALRTHPMWSPQGSISGRFGPFHILGKKIFKASIGFRSFANTIPADKAFIDGVQFEVWLHYTVKGSDKPQLLLSRHKDVDSMLLTLSKEFPVDVPDDFSIELKVNAGQYSENDWSCWISPVIVSKQLTYTKQTRRPGGYIFRR